MPGAGKRGFTLFTALVAFILIVLTILLVQAMIGAERNTTDIVSDIGEQAEMQAVADLARADALQTFNHGIRVVLEEHFTQSETDAGGTGSASVNYITIEYGKTNWEGDESIQDQFLKSWLGDRGKAGDERVGAFANRAANHLSTILAQAPDVGEYDLSFTNNNPWELKASMQAAFEESSKEDEFFEVIDCDGGVYNGCVGTFYVTLDLTKERMSDEAYEALPQIRVENTRTGRVMKVPMLPRGKFRIYVPLRIFKALAGAREIAIQDGGKVLSEGTHQNIIGEGEGCGGNGCSRQPENDTAVKARLGDRIEEQIDGMIGSYTKGNVKSENGFILQPSPKTVVGT
ncbi:hypothetical protein KKH30_04280, partial [Candidatus Micrarchaeota archaeon]|nr:hypothetical protein [Candidatus Micrarchaeota archaeon]MBU1939956.1 hypothetical protein [Candidatus Micrarchaeota archaeon]